MSEHRQSHTAAEDDAKVILQHRELNIPFRSSVQVQRPDSWHCTRHNAKLFGAPALDSHLLGKRHEEGDRIGPLLYEIDIQLFPPKKIGLEIEGEIHLKSRVKKHDEERHEFLTKEGWFLLYYPNEVIQRFPEVFVDGMKLVKEMVEKEVL